MYHITEAEPAHFLFHACKAGYSSLRENRFFTYGYLDIQLSFGRGQSSLRCVEKPLKPFYTNLNPRYMVRSIFWSVSHDRPVGQVWFDSIYGNSDNMGWHANQCSYAVSASGIVVKEAILFCPSYYQHPKRFILKCPNAYYQQESPEFAANDVSYRRLGMFRPVGHGCVCE